MILAYREITIKSPGGYDCVTPDGFFRHISALRAYRVVHLDEYDPSDTRCVSIVLLDPTEDTVQTAASILAMYGMSWTLARPAVNASVLNNLLGIQPSKFVLAAHDNFRTGKNEWLISASEDGKLSIVYSNRSSGRNCPLPVRLMRETDSLFKATVAAIITNYNYGHFLREAVASVDAQIIGPDEFIIVDDASTDMSYSVLEEIELSGKAVIRNSRNLGIVENFRACVAQTTSDYLFFLGADNRLRSDFILECRLALDANPDVDVAYTDVLLFGVLAGEQARKVGASLLGHAPTNNWDVYEWRFPDPCPETLATFRTSNFVHGSSMYRRSAYDRVGGYRSDGQPEDHNLFYRIWKSGGHLAHIAKPLLEYRQHSVAQANNRSALQVENQGLREQIAAVQRKFAQVEQSHRAQEHEILRLNAAYAEQNMELQRVNAAFAEQNIELRRVNAAFAEQSMELRRVNAAYAEQNTELRRVSGAFVSVQPGLAD
ncbi:glycosyltransferase [Methylobacterium sp. 092160098-2]|uniref:glycosyltransferase n=1 Tax=Methylobacterium sp. 092160098-2 TaxID=3025129 RepID=UPI002381D117|nr:glycosyltransferase [Methylobacterium sp. 092160098-2]MDE4915349.1 glycosyltransferase [Methylobacterium sp. 092160098-2]